MFIQHRLCFILSALAPFLLLQFYILHTLTNDRGATARDRAAYQLGTTIDTVKLGHPRPFSWSACLMVKDSNIILPEWLAYHYTVLPLRRLIVAVEPSSSDDPQSIFDLYEKIGMNITVWRNHSYWLGKKGSKHNNVQGYKLEWHQLVFYTECLKQLKSENRTWTTIIDVDEYLAFNYYHPMEKNATWCKHNATCEREYLDTIRRGSHFRTKLNQSATAAEYISKSVKQNYTLKHGEDSRLANVDINFNIPHQPCIVIDRYLITSEESGNEEIQQEIDKGFDAAKFHTYRFRHRAIQNPQVGKSIVDASRSLGKLILTPHRLYENEACSGGGAFVHNAAMSFRVHHYVGSWDIFRLKGVQNGKDDFEKRNRWSETVVDDTITRFTSSPNRTWLSQFVKIVGKEKALDLTERLRIREEWDRERSLLMMKPRTDELNS